MSRSEKRIPRLRSRGRANREKLLREAERLLATNNGKSLRFSDVFESAGVSRGSAYRIYNGIDDLMQDLAGEWVSNFISYLSDIEPPEQPENWTVLSDFIVERGAAYWAETKTTLKVMPRIRSNSPSSYKSAVSDLSECLARLFEIHFEMPIVPRWKYRLAFYTQLCDINFSDAVRADGYINDERLAQAQTLCRTYLSFHLPEQVPLLDRKRST